jgi:signal transduction histidine kinase
LGVVIVLFENFSFVAPPPRDPRGLVLLASFLATFLWVVDPRLSGKHPRLRLVFLVWQTQLGLFAYNSLGIIVALALPLLFSRRTAVIWLVVRNIVAIPWLTWCAWESETRLVPVSSPQPWSVATLVLTYLAWQVVAFLGGILIMNETEHRQQLAEANAKLRAAQALLADRARLAERLNISREIHDSFGHHLAALNLQLELAKHLTDGAARAAVERAHAVGRSLLGEVREIVSVWRAEASFDLRVSLLELAKGISPPLITVRFEDDLAVNIPVQSHALFRCAQEAITNAVRHAAARHVWIELQRANGGVVLSIQDDGRGQTQVVPGNGLRGIEERAVALGGRVQMGTRPGGGFEVEMWLPQNEEIL